MIITEQNGNTTTREVGLGIQDLKISKVSMDVVDVAKLNTMPHHRVTEFLAKLRECMHKPIPVYAYHPLTAQDEVRKAEGKEHACRATITHHI